MGLRVHCSINFMEVLAKMREYGIIKYYIVYEIKEEIWPN